MHCTYYCTCILYYIILTYIHIPLKKQANITTHNLTWLPTPKDNDDVTWGPIIASKVSVFDVGSRKHKWSGSAMQNPCVRSNVPIVSTRVIFVTVMIPWLIKHRTRIQKTRVQSSEESVLFVSCFNVEWWGFRVKVWTYFFLTHISVSKSIRSIKYGSSIQFPNIYIYLMLSIFEAKDLRRCLTIRNTGYRL